MRWGCLSENSWPRRTIISIIIYTLIQIYCICHSTSRLTVVVCPWGSWCCCKVPKLMMTCVNYWNNSLFVCYINPLVSLTPTISIEHYLLRIPCLITQHLPIPLFAYFNSWPFSVILAFSFVLSFSATQFLVLISFPRSFAMNFTLKSWGYDPEKINAK